jgi:hypothetical protein
MAAAANGANKQDPFGQNGPADRALTRNHILNIIGLF